MPMRIHRSIGVAIKNLNRATYLKFRCALHVAIKSQQLVSHRANRPVIGCVLVGKFKQMLRYRIGMMSGAHDTLTEIPGKPLNDVTCKQRANSGRYRDPEKKHRLLWCWPTKWGD